MEIGESISAKFQQHLNFHTNKSYTIAQELTNYLNEKWQTT